MDLMYKKCRNNFSVFGFVLFEIALVIPMPAMSAPWEFGTAVDLTLVHTDNLRLAVDGLEESETVFSVAPTFSLATNGDRLNADLQYRIETFFYFDAPEAKEIFHQVDANITADIVRDALFVYASAVNYQSIVSPDGTIPTNNLQITANRIDSTILEISPYWDQNLGFADIRVELGYIETNYDDKTTQSGSSTQDNNERRGVFSLNNHSRGQGLAWGLDYQYRRLAYESAFPWEYQEASANLGYWFNGVLRVFVSAGIETPFDSFFDPAMEDESWEGGLQYRPNQRLNLELAVGKRSFGNTYRVQLSYKLRRGQTAFSYNEDASTRGELGLDRRPLISTDNLAGFLDRPGSSDRFIRKAAEWTTSINLSKSDMSLRVFTEKRDRRSTDVGVALSDERFSGAAFRWTWRLGAKSNVGFVVDHTRRDTSLSKDKLTRLAVDYAYRISQRFSVALLAQHSEQKNDQSSIVSYAENQYHLTLRAAF